VGWAVGVCCVVKAIEGREARQNGPLVAPIPVRPDQVTVTGPAEIPVFKKLNLKKPELVDL
jgi:hypothetical protein